MFKRLAALTVASVSFPLLAVSTAGPAVAQQGPPDGRPCGNNYTNGQPFQMRTSPTPARGAGRKGETAVRVRRGAEVVLGSRLLLAQSNGPSKPCPNQRVGFFTRDAGRSQYVLVPNRNRVTNSAGLVRASKIANRDFRFFASYNINATTIGVRSGTTLVQIR